MIIMFVCTLIYLLVHFSLYSYGIIAIIVTFKSEKHASQFENISRLYYIGICACVLFQ